MISIVDFVPNNAMVFSTGHFPTADQASRSTSGPCSTVMHVTPLLGCFHYMQVLKLDIASNTQGGVQEAAMAGYAGRDAVIVGAVRTPIGKGKAGGALHDGLPVDLLAHSLKELV